MDESSKILRLLNEINKHGEEMASFACRLLGLSARADLILREIRAAQRLKKDLGHAQELPTRATILDPSEDSD